MNNLFTAIKVFTVSGETYILRGEETGFDRLFREENVPVVEDGHKRLLI